MSAMGEPGGDEMGWKGIEIPIVMLASNANELVRAFS